MLILYSTLGCHLCEQAKLVLASEAIVSRWGAIAYREVDIADSDDLVDRYGLRIPVLKHDSTQGEIGWPFDDEALDAWMSAQQT